MKKERTFVILKPDTIQRALVGELVTRIERAGLKLVGIKMVRATDGQVEKHYNKDEAWFKKVGKQRVELMKKAGRKVEKEEIEYGKDVVEALVSFMTVSPVVCMAWEGSQAVGIVKKLVGGTEPLTSEVGTIRGDLTLDSYELADTDGRAIRNLIHCSDEPSEAEREIKLWFDKGELFDYRHISEEILYDVNLDGIRE